MKEVDKAKGINSNINSEFYARDPRGETSALSCSRLAHGEASERACVRREVFPSGGTAWGDGRA